MPAWVEFRGPVCLEGKSADKDDSSVGQWQDIRHEAGSPVASRLGNPPIDCLSVQWTKRRVKYRAAMLLKTRQET